MEAKIDPTLDLKPETERLMDAVVAEYQGTRHQLKNLLAVIMAMAELAERNPAHTPRLIQCVLEKGPEMVNDMEALTKRFEQMRREVSG
jgi:hypothetical protein